MKNSITRLALLGSVSAATLLVTHSAYAQSTTCTQTGSTITCTDGSTPVLTAVVSPGTTILPAPAPGLTTANVTGPETIVYTATGPISTTAVRALTLNSSGGPLSFTPAAGTPFVNVITTGGVGANGVTINAPAQAATVSVGNITTSGTNSFGVFANGGTDLTLRTGNITTTGAGSRGIQAAQTGSLNITAGNITTANRAVSVSAGNSSNATVVTGDVVASGGGILVNGGTVSVTTGNVTTVNNGAVLGGFGVAAQGFGGNVSVRTGAVSTMNGSGIFTGVFNGAAGNIDIAGCPSVSTTGNNSSAIVAQATGTGNVTINCGALTTTGDGSNGVFSFSNGGNVTVNITSATTAGAGAFGLTANTINAGNVTINGGVITTTGIGSTGVFSRAGTGTIDAGYGNITTSGIGAGVNSASALDLASTGAINLRGSGATLRTNGAGVTAAVITGAGVTGNLGNITTTGAGAQGAVITSTAPINLTIGNVATTGNGVTVNSGTNATTLVTGTVAASDAGATGTVINSTGPITFTGGRQSANGATALTINGGAGAINASVNGAATTGTGNAVNITGTGPLSFANTGTISTVGANSIGLNIAGVTTASVNCGNVSTSGANSPAVVIAASGTTNVSCGTVTTTGAASDAINVTNSAGTTTVTGGTTSATGVGSRGIVVASSAPAATGLVTVNSGSVTANGNAVAASSSGGANVIVNATGNVASSTGTGITATTAGTTAVTIGAGTTTTGVQGVNLAGAAGNSLTVNGTLRNTAGTTPYTVLAGGPFTLTLGTAGTIVGPLAFTTGNDTFNNQGTFALPAALDFLTGTDVLNNSGTLTAFNGTSSIANLESFNNVGGLIDMRDGAANDIVNLGNANYVGSAGARLGLEIGGSAGGLTSDRLVLGGNASGSTALNLNFLAGSAIVDQDGVLIVDAGTATGTPFAIGGQSSFGLINFGLRQTGGDTFLVSTVDDAVFDSLVVNQMVKETAWQAIDAHIACSASRRSRGDTDSSPLSLCGQLYASNDRVGGSRTGNAFGSSFDFNDRRKTEREGAQLEVGFKAGGNFEIGLTGGYTHAETDLRSGSGIDISGRNYGAYAQFGGDSGLYAGIVGQRGEFDVRFGNGDIIPLVRFDGSTTSVDGEVGFRAGRLIGAAFDAHAGLTWARTRLDDFTTGNINFDNDRFTSYRGRVGARLTFDGAYAPFIDGKVYHEFKGDGDVNLGSGSLLERIEGRGRGTWGRIEAGVAGNGMLSAWVDVGDVKGWGVRAGFRF